MDQKQGKRLSLPIASRATPRPQQNVPTHETGKTSGPRHAKPASVKDGAQATATSPPLTAYPPSARRRLPASATTSLIPRRGDENLAPANADVSAVGAGKPGKPRRLPVSMSRGALDRLA